MLAAAEIRAGDAELVVAGGMEIMNQAPYLVPGAGSAIASAMASSSTRPSRRPVVRHRGLPHGHARRAGGDSDARQPRGPGRVRAESHQKAIAAIDAGRFDAEMVPVTVRDAKGRETVVTVDEGPRRDTTMEALARLKPVFALPDGEDRGAATVGTVTAGNAPGHHGRRRGHRRGQRAGRRAARPEAAGPDRRLRPGRGGAEVAVPGARSRASDAARPDRAPDRGLRPHRDQRGVRRPDARRWPRARLRLVKGQCQRRRDRARPSDRCERRADRRHARSTSWIGGRAGTGSRRCASAAAARWRWPSNGSEAPPDGRTASHDRRRRRSDEMA